MMWGYGNNYFSDVRYGTFGLLIPFMVLDLVLRGFALWRSARKSQNIWFIALLIVNSMGILPLIYLLLNRAKPIVVIDKRKSK